MKKNLLVEKNPKINRVTLVKNQLFVPVNLNQEVVEVVKVTKTGKAGGCEGLEDWEG